jgi:hypothetical protein
MSHKWDHQCRDQRNEVHRRAAVSRLTIIPVFYINNELADFRPTAGRIPCGLHGRRICTGLHTLNKIDLKAAKRRILATGPPTDILHKATLINSALTPLYDHVLMALPAAEKDLQPLYKEIK